MMETWVILDVWTWLCREAGAKPRRRSKNGGHRARALSAREALALPDAGKLREALGDEACRSAKALGCALSQVARSTPGVDGRVFARATSGRWYVVAGDRV